jgi:hypothetical protein
MAFHLGLDTKYFKSFRQCYSLSKHFSFRNMKIYGCNKFCRFENHIMLKAKLF